jgi:hypothetical protein
LENVAEYVFAPESVEDERGRIVQQVEPVETREISEAVDSTMICKNLKIKNREIQY